MSVSRIPLECGGRTGTWDESFLPSLTQSPHLPTGALEPREGVKTRCPRAELGMAILTPISSAWLPL